MAQPTWSEGEAPTFRDRLKELGKLAAGAAAFSITFVALQPDPSDPGPPFVLSFVALGVAWIAASVVFERRLPWRRGTEPRTQPRLEVMAGFLVIAVLISLIVVGFLYVPETPPVSRSTWIYDRLLGMFVAWAGSAAVIFAPRRLVLPRSSTSPEPEDASRASADVPLIRWLGDHRQG